MAKADCKNGVDYSSVELPDPEVKPYGQWTYAQRRAFLLGEVVRLGGSRLVSRTEMARLFEKSIGQLSQDIQALDAYVASNVSSNQVKSTVLTSFEKAFRDLQEHGKSVEAYEMALSFASYMQSIGVLEREADKMDLTGPIQIVIQRKGSDLSGEHQDG